MAASLVKDMLGQYSDHFAVLGVVAASFLAIRYLLQIWDGIRTYVLPAIFGPGVNFKKLGKWAVVTGSTDGIGKAYAEQLAKKGMSIVLISRSKDKLENVSREIESKFGVETKYVVADFSKGQGIYTGIRQQLEGLDIGVLVNNVGLGYKYPEYFLEVEDREQFFQDLVSINITSMIMMTSIVLPGMVERKKGAILNISSASGMSPVPFLSVYSATKSFVDFFSAGLRKEYEDKGIQIQCVLPFFVATKLSGIRRHNLFVPTPNTYVRGALATVGHVTSTFGYWSHGIQGYLGTCFPQNIMLSVTTAMMKSGRNAALKKMKSRKNN